MGMTGLDVRNNETGDIEHIQADGLCGSLVIKHRFSWWKISIEIKAIFKHRQEQRPLLQVFLQLVMQDPKYQQAITAAGSGAIAALDTLAYIDNLWWNWGHV